MSNHGFPPGPPPLPNQRSNWSQPPQFRGPPSPPGGIYAPVYGATGPYAPPLGQGQVRMMFDTQTPGLVKLAGLGSLLSFLTLGIYRFWFIVNVRREMWNRTVLAGSHAEYTGTVMELFKGFLLALIFLLPIWGLYTFGSILLEKPGQQGVASAMTTTAVVLFFLFLYFASFRARRYRLSRTLWRGVRFRQSGSAIAYMFMNFGWLIAAMLTLSLSVPFGRAQLERYRMHHTWFGDRRFYSQASGLAMLLPHLLLLLLVLGPIGAVIGYYLAHSTPEFWTNLQEELEKLGKSMSEGRKVYTPRDAELVVLFGLGIFSTVWLYMGPILLWPFYRAYEWRSYMRRMSFGGMRFKSEFSAWHIYANYLLFMAIMFFGMMLIGLIAALFFTIFGISKDMSAPAIIVGGAGYLAVLWLISTLRVRLILFGITGELIRSTSVIGIETLDDVISRPDRVGAIGDDFAGGFDIGAI